MAELDAPALQDQAVPEAELDDDQEAVAAELVAEQPELAAQVVAELDAVVAVQKPKGKSKVSAWQLWEWLSTGPASA